MNDYKNILEAAQFYLECLKEVRKSLVKEDILPNNEVSNIVANLFNDSSRNGKLLEGKFKLNGVAYEFSFPVKEVISEKRDPWFYKRLLIEQLSTEVASQIISNLSR